jgi:hypothetical protein
MTTTLTARFDGKVLIPEGHVDLPRGARLRLRIDPAPPAEQTPSPHARFANVKPFVVSGESASDMLIRERR